MSCCFCNRSKRAWGSSQKFKPLSGSLPEILCPGAQASWLCSVFAGSKRSTVQGSQRSGFGLFGPVVVVDLGLQFWRKTLRKPTSTESSFAGYRVWALQLCKPSPVSIENYCWREALLTLQNAAKTAIQQKTRKTSTNPAKHARNLKP